MACWLSSSHSSRPFSGDPSDAFDDTLTSEDDEENKSKESKDPKSTIGTKLDNNPILPSNDLKNKLELEKDENNELTDSDESKTEELNLKEQTQTKPKDLNLSKKDKVLI